MSRLLLTILLLFALTACSSSEKSDDRPESSERAEEPRANDDDSAPDDDDSAPGDDDSGAADSVEGGPEGKGLLAILGTTDDPDAAAALDAAAAAAPPEVADGPPPPEFEPPPPGKKGILEKAAALMAGTRFRWVQGSKDVAVGLYGAPVMINLWSCTDKNIDATLEWLKIIEKTYSDQMLSILVPANVAERSLTGQDNICGRSVRFGRSLGVDVGKGVMHELYVKKLPTTLVFVSQGTVVAKHEGPVKAGSTEAKKLEGALQREMAPLIEGRTLAP